MCSPRFEAPSLAAMKPEELREWLTQCSRELVNHQRFVQRYLNRHRGRQTGTMRQYAGFQRLANDLLVVLDSVLTNIDQYAQEQTYIRSLEAELEHLQEAEYRRRLDREIRSQQGEQRRCMDAAIRKA